MAWKKTRNGWQPDGAFTEPVDSFERMYNRELADAPPVDHDEISLQNGWPLATKPYLDSPTEGPEQHRREMDTFFDAHTQETALDNGNTHEELDAIAKSLLAGAVLAGCPVTDAEQRVAQRLGIDTSSLATQQNDRQRHHRLGI